MQTIHPNEFWYNTTYHSSAIDVTKELKGGTSSPFRVCRRRIHWIQRQKGGGRDSFQ